ncbi:MAG: tyrosine-type recombinase/integrase, partial [Desulfocapsaceae bacterium]|nr:tyrosine-type recombinase/integrase [Desulfocapsaceae bacterium]
AVLNYTFENEENDSTYMNPVNVLSSKKRKAWYQVERRRTLIKNSDLPEWSKAVEDLNNSIVRDFLLFLLYTGLRRNEAARLQWDQVDFREGCFTIPTTKNGEPHTLPMSDYLKTLLMRRKAKAWADNPFVFPGNGKEGHLQEPKKPMATVTANTGIVFTCHDLRRTFATIAESLDLSGYTVKALLNHKQQLGDVTGGYIILNVERLREPMQKITNAIHERIRKQHGQIVPMDPIQRESM